MPRRNETGLPVRYYALDPGFHGVPEGPPFGLDHQRAHWRLDLLARRSAATAGRPLAGTGRHPDEGDTRERILDIAMDLFIEQGYDKTSLRQIADRLGFTQAAIYYHFAANQTALSALHIKGHAGDHEEMEQQFRRILANGAIPARDRVRLSCALGALLTSLMSLSDLEDLGPATYGDLLREAITDLLEPRDNS